MKTLAKKCLTGLKSQTCSVLGSQWGDEGKGKLVDILAQKYDICARFNGGANAGHTLVVNNRKYAMHLLPCGILVPNVINILGNGVVVHLQTMFDELKQLDNDNIDYRGRLLLSDRAQIVTEMQIQADIGNEQDPNKRFLGTTKRGIGPTYASKANRIGLRVSDLINWDHFKQKYQSLQKRFQDNYNVKVDGEKDLSQIYQLRDRILNHNMIVDGVLYMHNALYKENKRVLFEGANASMLDIDFGTYPYTTSSSTGSGGIIVGLGVPPSALETNIAVVKAYTTRVGEGPFPTEQKNDVGKALQKIGHEFGATTGRPRRCGWLDIPVFRYANMLNDFSSINLTKLDVLDNFDHIQIGVKYQIDGQDIEHMPANLDDLAKVKVVYETLPGWKTDISKISKFEDLPTAAKNYINRIEQLTKKPVTWIGNGAKRESMIFKDA